MVAAIAAGGRTRVGGAAVSAGRAGPVAPPRQPVAAGAGEGRRAVTRPAEDMALRSCLHVLTSNSLVGVD